MHPLWSRRHQLTRVANQTQQLSSFPNHRFLSLLHYLQGERLRFYCQTCPYLQPIEDQQRVAKRVALTRKKADDILGGDKAWENVDQTDATCPDCGNKRAYYMQIQIRSADEPMTIFYKCTACKKMWSSN